MRDVGGNRRPNPTSGQATTAAVISVPRSSLRTNSFSRTGPKSRRSINSFMWPMWKPTPCRFYFSGRAGTKETPSRIPYTWVIPARMMTTCMRIPRSQPLGPGAPHPAPDTEVLFRHSPDWGSTFDPAIKLGAAQTGEVANPKIAAHGDNVRRRPFLRRAPRWRQNVH
jgi:hypothetical protein